MRHVLFGLFGVIFFSAYKSYAYIATEGNVTASYGLFLYKTNFTGSDQLPTSPVLGDLGFVTNGDITDKGSLEIALFHMNKMYYRNIDALYLAEKTELIHIMMGYRRWLSEKWSLGLGFYGAYSIGDYKILHSNSNVHEQIDTSARDTVEYGLDSSIQYELWSKNKESVFVDLRYSYSISNKENEKGDHYTLFLAYRHFIQEKNPTPMPERDEAPDQFVEPRKDVPNPNSEGDRK